MTTFNLKQLETYLNAAQVDIAEQLINDLIDSSEKNNTVLLFNSAELCINYNQDSLAEKIYQTLLGIDAHNIAALGRLGDIAQRKGDNHRAVELFQRITRSIDNPDEWVYIGLANALEKIGEYQQALTALCTITANSALQLRIARLQYHSHLLEESIENFLSIDMEQLMPIDYQIINDSQKYALLHNNRGLLNNTQRLLDSIMPYRFQCTTQGFIGINQLSITLTDILEDNYSIDVELLTANQVIATAQPRKKQPTPRCLPIHFTIPESLLKGQQHHFALRFKNQTYLLANWLFITPVLIKNPAFKPILFNTPLWKVLPQTPSHNINPLKLSPSVERLEQLTAQLNKTSPHDSQRHYLLHCECADLLFHAEKFQQALAHLQTALQLNVKETSRAIITYSQILITLGKEQNALSIIETALERYPDNAALLTLKDNLLAKQRPKAIKFIAFYLPQFHPIAENNQWWGEGFTEWTNVTAATPLFTGHLQPRRPTALGYYDLRLAETANAQFALASRFGIDGFCYYYYWFEGRRILEKPLDDLIQGKTNPFPFCICWANEDWTRRWDGRSGEVLLAQNHSPESDFEFIKSITPLLKHPSYIRLDNKPILLIYRADQLASPKETLIAWRTWCIDEGIGELYLCAVQSFDFEDPRPFGFDAAVEFPPHYVQRKYPQLTYRQPITKIKNLHADFKGQVLSYPAFAKAAMQRPREPYTMHRSCFLAWDNTARRGKDAHIFHEFSPAIYQHWLTTSSANNAIEQKTGITFINAWNEWAEGSVLEPDSFFGYELLETTYQAKRLVNYQTMATYWHKNAPQFNAPRCQPSQHLILIGHDAHFNGAQINLLNMARCFKRDLAMQITIILMDGGDLLADYQKVAPTLVLSQTKNWQKALIHSLKKQRNLGTQHAITNTAVTGTLIKFLKKYNYRVVSLIHELPTLIKAYQLENACMAIAAQSDNIVFAANIVAASFCENYYPEAQKVLIAPQGIVLNPYQKKRTQYRAQLRASLALENNSQLIIGCGYGDTRKGIDLFVQLAKQISQTYANAAFIWVGELEHTLAPYIHADIERLQLTDKLHITGKTNDTARYFIAGDIFALTSREDPFPSVVMEAFDAQLPVVAFHGGGGYIDIINEKTGALVPYLDTQAMAKIIIELLIDNPRREQIGKYCQHYCQSQLTYPPYLKKLLALLNHVPAPQVAAGLLTRQAWFANTPMPTISVIVPNYNYGRYLELRLRTIIDQTLKPYEIIILDDNSTDYSLALISAMQAQTDIKITVVTNETNTGNPFLQWAKGLEQATGELIWIAEADDYCEPVLLETLAKRFINKAIVMAWCDSIIVDANGNSAGFAYKNYYSENYGYCWQHDFLMDGKQFMAQCLLIENTLPNASAVLFRKAALNTDLSLISQYQFSGDWWFWLNLADTGKVYYCKEPLNYHRRHSLSVMGGVLKNGEQLLIETLNFYQRVVDYKPAWLSAKPILGITARLQKLYNHFIVSDNETIAASIEIHEKLGSDYQQLMTILKPQQAFISVYTPSAAILIIAAEEFSDNKIIIALLKYLAKQYHIELILLLDNSDIISPDSTYTGIVDSLHYINNVTATGNAQLITLLAQTEKKTVLSLGLVAHSLVAKCPQKPAEWLILFSGECANNAKNKSVDLELLASALQQSSQLSFIAEKPPKILTYLNQQAQLPLNKITLCQSVTPPKTPRSVIYCLAMAQGVPIELWQPLIETLWHCARRLENDIILRLLITDPDNNSAILQKTLQAETNVELVYVSEKPQDFSLFADIGLIMQTDKILANTLAIDFKQGGLKVAYFNELFTSDNCMNTEKLITLLSPFVGVGL